jgi:hypothetical protein
MGFVWSCEEWELKDEKRIWHHSLCSRLGVVRRTLFEKKCVYDDLGKRGREYGNKIYFYHDNGKWLMVSHMALC